MKILFDDCCYKCGNNLYYVYSRANKSSNTKQVLSYKLKRRYPVIAGINVSCVFCALARGPRNSTLTLKKRHAAIKIMGGKCVSCGYNEDIRALQFDHMHMNINRESPYRVVIKVLAGKIKEYQLLCANCNKIKQIENHEFRL